MAIASCCILMGPGSARKREKHYVILGFCVRLLRPLHLGVIMQWRYIRPCPIEILTSSYMSYGLWGALGALSSSLAAFH
jgi:hypothetical protein